MSNQNRAISRTIAEENRAPFNLDAMSWSAVQALVEGSKSFRDYGPEGVYAVDPRDGGATLFNEGRAKRPKDYAKRNDGGSPAGSAPECPICAGKTTPIIDITDLSESFTFINTNLYPILAPSPAGANPSIPGPARFAGEARGAHFLQWTSSDHEVDWPELTPEERLIVMQRLAALEATLLELPAGASEATREGNAYVEIIKNVGRSVGGSLSHGHQQIALSNVMPKRVKDNAAFLNRHGEPFSRTMLRESPSDLIVEKLEMGTLLVPFYMRRPFDLLFLLHNDGPSYLLELSSDELSGLAEGFSRGMELMRGILLSLGREIAYNVLVHTGPGAGIYLEFLPWTQENGGYEQLGLSACQGVPREAARILREGL